MTRIIIYSIGKEKEFERQAKAAEKKWKNDGHQVVMIPVDVVKNQNKTDRAQIVKRGISSSCIDGRLDMILFFCHGTKKQIELGFHMYNANVLADAIVRMSTMDRVIALFCCWTGGNGGFAQALSEECDCKVVANTTRGHTSANPNKVLYKYGELKGAVREILGYSKKDWLEKMDGARKDDFELEVLERIKVYG